MRKIASTPYFIVAARGDADADDVNNRYPALAGYEWVRCGWEGWSAAWELVPSAKGLLPAGTL